MTFEESLQPITSTTESRCQRSRSPERLLQLISPATILSWEETKDLLGVLPDAAMLTLFTDGSVPVGFVYMFVCFVCLFYFVQL